MDKIDLIAMLQLLHSGEWISLRWITGDIKKGAGGRVVETDKCRICRANPINFPKESKSNTEAINSDKKNPEHNIHFTRNIEFPNKKIRKVHPILITAINQRELL